MVDTLNQRYGHSLVHLAGVGMYKEEWKMEQKHLSPAYTTQFKDLLTIEL